MALAWTMPFDLRSSRSVSATSAIVLDGTGQQLAQAIAVGTPFPQRVQHRQGAHPACGAMQSAVTSVGLRLVPWSYLALGLCWAAATAATGITAFVLRTRVRRTEPPWLTRSRNVMADAGS